MLQLMLFFLAFGCIDAQNLQRLLDEAKIDIKNEHFNLAFDKFAKIRSSYPDHPQGYFEAGNLFESLGDVKSALELYKTAQRIMPSNEEVYTKIGEACYKLGDGRSAISILTEGLVHTEQAENVLYQLGSALSLLDDKWQASRAFRAVVIKNPSNFQAWNNLGNSYMGTLRFRQAIDAFTHALKILPTHPVPLTNLVVVENRICDWTHYKEHHRALIDTIRSGGFANAFPPFHAFELALSPEELLVNAANWARRSEAADSGYDRPQVEFDVETNALNVGYLSASGFHSATTTARALQGMFAAHQHPIRAICFAQAPEDGSTVRKRIRQGCHQFFDTHAMGFADYARFVHNNKVHIAVDLSGFTMQSVAELFSLGLAPIHVSFHGFPGTMGSHFIDYLTADAVCAPPENLMHFREALIILPFTYLCTDHGHSRQEALRPIGPNITRSRFGFGEDDIILSCFNQLYKIEPKIFKVWMRILQRVDKAKLWLLKFDGDAAINLKQYAADYGIDPNRIVVHDMFPIEEEFPVKSLAELFLDTPIFNAHTTASDVLWAGVPILSLPGENYAQRVSASFLQSVGMPELIARNLREYEELAVRLAMCKACRQKLKAKLRQNRLESKMFFSEQWVPYWEKALKITWEIYQAEFDPMHVIVCQHKCKPY